MEWEDLEARIQAFLGSDLADEPVACTAARDLLRGAMTELEKRQEEIMEAARFGQQLLRQLQSATSTDDQAADEKRQTALQIKVLQHKLRSAEQDAEALATDHESLKTQLAANETFLSVERQRCKRLEKRAAELEEECQEVEATATFLRTENIELSVALQHYERQIEQLQKCIEDLSSMSTSTFGLSQDADRPKSKKDKRRVSIEGATKPRRRTTLGGTSDIASAPQSRETRDPKGMSSPDVPLKPIPSGSTTEATTDPGTGGTTPWAERDQFRAPSTRSFASEDDVLDSSRFHDYAPVPLSARFGSPPVQAAPTQLWAPPPPRPPASDAQELSDLLPPLPDALASLPSAVNPLGLPDPPAAPPLPPLPTSTQPRDITAEVPPPAAASVVLRPHAAADGFPDPPANGHPSSSLPPLSSTLPTADPQGAVATVPPLAPQTETTVRVPASTLKPSAPDTAAVTTDVGYKPPAPDPTTFAMCQPAEGLPDQPPSANPSPPLPSQSSSLSLQGPQANDAGAQAPFAVPSTSQADEEAIAPSDPDGPNEAASQGMQSPPPHAAPVPSAAAPMGPDGPHESQAKVGSPATHSPEPMAVEAHLVTEELREAPTAPPPAPDGSEAKDVPPVVEPPTGPTASAADPGPSSPAGVPSKEAPEALPPGLQTIPLADTTANAAASFPGTLQPAPLAPEPQGSPEAGRPDGRRVSLQPPEGSATSTNTTSDESDPEDDDEEQADLSSKDRPPAASPVPPVRIPPLRLACQRPHWSQGSLPSEKSDIFPTRDPPPEAASARYGRFSGGGLGALAGLSARGSLHPAAAASILMSARGPPVSTAAVLEGLRSQPLRMLLGGLTLRPLRSQFEQLRSETTELAEMAGVYSTQLTQCVQQLATALTASHQRTQDVMRETERLRRLTDELYGELAQMKAKYASAQFEADYVLSAMENAMRLQTAEGAAANPSVEGRRMDYSTVRRWLRLS